MTTKTTKTSKTKKKHPPKGHPVQQPTTPALVSIVNQSSKVSDADVAQAVPALGKQLANDYAPVWGTAPGVEFVPRGVGANGNVMAFVVDAIPEAPGALGYHDVDRDDSVTGVVGMTYIKVAVVDGYDWRTTLSHELLELAGDAPANRWADGPDGSDYAFEMCDAVESDTYEIDGVPVSNFVYPAFFDPWANAVDRLDHMGTLKKPFTMTNGGYQIKRTEPGQVSQVFALHEAEGHHVVMALPSHKAKHGRAVIVVFGDKYPEDKKAAKIAKVQRRYGKVA